MWIETIVDLRHQSHLTWEDGQNETDGGNVKMRCRRCRGCDRPGQPPFRYIHLMTIVHDFDSWDGLTPVSVHQTAHMFGACEGCGDTNVEVVREAGSATQSQLCVGCIEMAEMELKLDDLRIGAM